MEQLNLILDGIIILLSFWVLKILVGYGGLIGKALTTIGIGVLVFGVAQIIETTLSIWSPWDLYTIEMVHRLILTIGFIITIFGYKSFMRRQSV
jgi:hypothetical protein